MPPSPQAVRRPRVVFLTREPVLHQRGGSTTYALGLLHLLRNHARVTLVATTAYSRSPRLFFRLSTPVPEGVRLRFPGYWRFGKFYICPFRPKAWIRAASRWEQGRSGRGSGHAWLTRCAQRWYGDRLYTNAWDLTAPTRAESRVAAREIAAARASCIVGNYCFWGPFFSSGRLAARRTAILMHDLLSARVDRFQAAGLPLDCPPLTAGREMQWLSGAQTVLAAQEREAEAIRPQVSARVLVAPILLQPQALDKSLQQGQRCLFVGSNIQPNRSGLQFLLGEVWPRVREILPGATLAVAGTICQVLGEFGEEETLRAQGVEALGVVASLEGEYAKAAICLVPLRVGTGIKVKLLEALAFGKAIVSTRVGVQGLEAWAEQAMVVEDSAEAFAREVTLLLRDAARREEFEAAALRLAEEHFGPGRELDPEFTAALL